MTNLEKLIQNHKEAGTEHMIADLVACGCVNLQNVLLDPSVNCNQCVFYEEHTDCKQFIYDWLLQEYDEPIIDEQTERDCEE